MARAERIEHELPAARVAHSRGATAEVDRERARRRRADYRLIAFGVLWLVIMAAVLYGAFFVVPSFR